MLKEDACVCTLPEMYCSAYVAHADGKAYRLFGVWYFLFQLVSFSVHSLRWTRVVTLCIPARINLSGIGTYCI
jgi:hypothetical protein